MAGWIDESALPTHTLKAGTVVVFQGVAILLKRDTAVGILDYPHTLDAVPPECRNRFAPPGPPNPPRPATPRDVA